MVKYNRLRIQANRRHKDTLGDSFHDGSEVLPEVTHWHRYLRRVARNSDSFTHRVLDLVDKKMLVGQVELRAEAAEICKLLGEDIHEHNSVSWGDLGTEFETFLYEVEGLAETELARSDGGSHDLFGNEISSSSTIHSDFKSTQELLSQPVLPVILRSQQPRAGGPVSRPPSRLEIGSLRNQQSRESLGPCQSTRRPDTAMSVVTTMRTTNVRPFTSLWVVEADLKNFNKASKFNRLLRRNPKPRSIKLAKQQSSQDELGDHYKFRDIVRLSCAVNLHFISSPVF